MAFRRDDIQGLRALAITLVVLYHASQSWMPGGFLGVDVFFVISGYLITRNLVKEIQAGTFSCARFYGHRVRRLFPALFVMLACVSLAAYLTLSPFYQAEFGRTLVATALFASNIEFEHLSGYFDEASSLKPLLHTWSLAVEEQFYLLFPLLLVFAWRHLNRRLLSAFMVCGLLSLAIYLWLHDIRSPNAAFFLTPARVFELMIGAALAVKPLPAGWSRQLLATAGVALILACSLVPRLAFLDIGPLLACLGAGAIIGAGERGPSHVGTMLSLRPVTFIGGLSYSLYLWHWPILSLAKNYLLRDLTGSEIVAAMCVTVILATLSWRFVEKPFLAAPLDRKRGLAAAIGSVGAIILGIALVLGNGFPQRFSPEANRLFAYRGDFSPWRANCHGDAYNHIAYANACTFGAAHRVQTVAVWADSLGSELAPALGEVLPQRTILQLTYSGCPPAIDFTPDGHGECAAHNRAASDALLRDRQVETVILTARYSSYPGIWDGFTKAVAALAAAHKRVILVYPSPEFLVTAPDATGLLQSRGRNPRDYRIPVAEFQSENAWAITKLNALAARYGLATIHPQSLFCDDRFCKAYDGHDVLYFDGVHLGMSGARKLATAIKAQLALQPAR